MLATEALFMMSNISCNMSENPPSDLTCLNEATDTNESLRDYAPLGC